MPPLSISRRRFGQWCALSAMPAWARAQPRAGERVRIAVGGQSVLYYLPLTVAQELGFFRDEGLDVQVQDHPGGALALRAVHEGEADVCCGAYDHVIRQQPQGVVLRSLVLLGRTPQLALAASVRNWPVRSVAGFKGLRVGVARASTQDVAVTKAAPEGTEIRRFDDDASAMQALISGQVDAIGCSVTVAAQIAKRVPAGTYENKFTLVQQSMGIAMRPGQDELTKAVNDFVAKNTANGELNKLYQKWLQADLPKMQ